MENEIFNNVRIEKLSAEFTIWDNTTPHGKYKIKVYVTFGGKYIAYTNIQVVDEDGTPYCGVGHGEDDISTMKDAICNFNFMRSKIKDEKIEYSFIDPIEF